MPEGAKRRASGRGRVRAARIAGIVHEEFQSMESMRPAEG